jgi:hypothetical protein
VDNAASRFGNPAFKTFYDKVQQARETNGSSSSRPKQTDWESMPMLVVVVVARLLPSSTRCSSSDLRMLSPRCPATSVSRGGIGRGSITAAGWSSTFFAGCA